MRRGRAMSTDELLGHPAGPAGEHDDAVAEASRLPDVVGDEEHVELRLPPDPLQLVVHQVAGHGVEGAERLVHEQHVGLLGQRPGQGHPLAHATGQLVGLLVDEAARGAPARAARPPGVLRSAARHAAQPQGQLDVLAHGQPREERGLLEHQGGLPLRHGLRRPSGWSRPATRLSRVVLPQPEAPTRQTNSPALDLEGDAVESEHAVVPAPEPLADCVQGHPRRPRPPVLLAVGMEMPSGIEGGGGHRLGHLRLARGLQHLVEQLRS